MVLEIKKKLFESGNLEISAKYHLYVTTKSLHLEVQMV